MSIPEQDRPNRPNPDSPAGPGSFWGADRLDELLAAPLEAGPLARILAAAAAPAEAGQVPGEEAALNAFREAFPVVAAPRLRILARMSGRAAVVALAGGLVLSGGAAAAAAGALPGAAQQTASDVLARLGVSVPGADDHAGDHPNRHDPSTQRLAPTGEQTAASGDGEHAAASEISKLARSTTATGVDKGAVISGAASDGKSQAGQNGKATNPPTPAKKTPAPQATKRHNGSTHTPPSGGSTHTPPTGGPTHTPSPKAAVE